MSAIINKVTGLVNSAVTKSGELTNFAIYWSKVGAELGKSVYKAEGMAPPSQAQFKSVYECITTMLAAPNKGTIIKNRFQSLGSDNTEAALKLGVNVVQCVGFFSLGEIIGRRQIVGYPSFGHAEHH